MTSSVIVASAGMIPFIKPGASEPYPVMAAKAIRAALANAGLEYSKVQQAYAGYVYGDSTAGQRGHYEVGMTGIPRERIPFGYGHGLTRLKLEFVHAIWGVLVLACDVGHSLVSHGICAKYDGDLVLLSGLLEHDLKHAIFGRIIRANDALGEYNHLRTSGCLVTDELAHLHERLRKRLRRLNTPVRRHANPISRSLVRGLL